MWQPRPEEVPPPRPEEGLLPACHSPQQPILDVPDLYGAVPAC